MDAVASLVILHVHHLNSLVCGPAKKKYKIQKKKVCPLFCFLACSLFFLGLLGVFGGPGLSGRDNA